jgi:nitrite reductase/ring-hydroxylating ferredoxin subunit/Fe-S cluster biogenesis protein NfuA
MAVVDSSSLPPTGGVKHFLYELATRVEAALETIRPLLASHGGDVELVLVEPARAEIRFRGACDGCAASVLSFHSGVKKAVQRACPEITDVREAQGAPVSRIRSHFVSPFALRTVGGWTDAGLVADIPDGGIRAVALKTQRIVLARHGAAVTCFEDSCAHLGKPIGDGIVENGVLTCSWHGFQYDLVSGECVSARDMRLKSHVVRIIAGRIEVRLGR